ncbi:MAG: peptidase, partial [Gemmatimonadetes bacterium]|nr:peptidase [Gemmatimonadota bacterium]
MKKRSYTSIRTFLCAGLCAGLLVVTGTALHAQNVTTPMAQFGHNIGDDYWLATYTELTAYWQKLASESPRMVLDTIGYTAEGRPHLMAIITSAANHANLEQHKTNARRLALANDLSDEEARELSQTAKAVVWIDGGLHATEVLGAAQLMEMAYQMVSLDDAETLRFLDDVVT